MKTIYFVILLTFTLSFLINISNASEINNNNNQCIKDTDKFIEPFYTEHYIIGINKIFNDNQELTNFIYEISEKVHNVIVNNIDTYENPSLLDEIQKLYEINIANGTILKIYSKYGTVRPMFYDNTFVLLAYLNPKIIDKVKSIEGISYVQKNAVLYDYAKKSSINTNFEKKYNCRARLIGYPCCSSNVHISAYKDSDGDWGYENNEWCGITPLVEKCSGCFSEAFGYPCCSNSTKVIFVDEFGKWGAENDEWCGIKE